MKASDFKIKLNQNIWVLITSLITLGISEYFCLKTLYIFGLLLSVISSLSIIVTLFVYTKKYSKK
jgi:hypothetical protein